MSKRKKSALTQDEGRREPGGIARSSTHTLTTYAVGALPIVNRLIERMRLEELLLEYLPVDDRRTKVPTCTGLLLLLKNLLFSREPIYGVGEWADRYAPDLVGLTREQRHYLNDDRLGRCLDRLFVTEQGSLVLAVVRHAIQEFGLRLDELHNDSTTISFFGAYSEAAKEGEQRGRSTPAITFGHSKDHRPDLKQLLYILTVTEDGGVPVYFTTKGGNVTDDKTHQDTWNLLCDLVGHSHFLYVADCKLATIENMKYIDQRGGRFISVLPASRKEDEEFREQLAKEPGSLAWNSLYDITDDDGQVRDRLSIWPRETLTVEGYRLWWFHSTRKVHLDEVARLKQIDRATCQLNELRGRLTGPRTRFRESDQVRQAVAAILDDTRVRGWLKVGIQEWSTEDYRQTTPGRPGKNTKYVKVEKPSYDLTWEVDNEALAKAGVDDGVFPLITNVGEFSPLETLQAYKRQPVIEKRFSHLKTDFAVAPVYLKNVSRIQALLCVYFFVLLVETLLQRELRQAMKSADVEALPLYPEGRPCKRPTTRRVIDVFESVQRHTLRTTAGDEETFVTELSRLERRILKLLGVARDNYGR